MPLLVEISSVPLVLPHLSLVEAGGNKIITIDHRTSRLDPPCVALHFSPSSTAQTVRYSLSSRLDTSSGAASGAPFGSRAVVPEGCCRFGLCRDLDHFFVFPLPFPLWVDGGSGAALLAVVGGADAAASLQAFSELGMCSDRLQCGVRSIRMLISAGSAGCRGSVCFLQFILDCEKKKKRKKSDLKYFFFITQSKIHF